MKSTDYKQLKKQIEEQYQKAIALADKERMDGLAAIDTVWKMLHVPRRKHNKEIISPEGPETPIATVQMLPIIYGTLIDTLKKSLPLVPPEKFVCQNALDAMEKLTGIKFNHGSVANCLKKLVKDGIIELIKQGHGKTPSEYKYKKSVMVTEEKT